MNHVFTTLDTWFLDTVSFRDLAFHYSSNTFYVHSRPYPNNCSLALVWIPSILPWLFIHSLFPNTHDWTIFWLLPTYYPSFPHILLPFKPILNFMDNLYIILLWELVHKEEWGPKNWCFQIVVLEKTLESPLDSKEINPEYSLEGLTLKLKFQYFGHLMWRADSLEKTLMLGKIEGRRRGQQRMG